jgi:hypothetical protein
MMLTDLSPLRHPPRPSLFRKGYTWWIGKLVVKLHYKGKLDLYSLASIHEPEIYARSHKKQKIPGSIRWAVWRRDNFTCVYCLAWGASLTLDHVVPEKYGGKPEVYNLVTACNSCNQKKGSSSFEAFTASTWLLKKRQQHAATTGTNMVKLSQLRSEILNRVRDSACR